MRLRDARLILALAIGLGTAPARAAGIDIPGGRLADAIVTLGRQANVSVGLSDPALADLRVRAVRGARSPRVALDRLLAGSGAAATVIDAETFHIARQPRRRPAPAAMPPARAAAAAAAGTSGTDIVVTASKRDTRLTRFPGTATLLDGAALAGAGSDGTAAIVARLPTVSSTHLGPGRNKLFIRGVADSSFNGPTQATVGEYLGDVRLNYNAPDPDLTLYDVDRVEVLEGPQGTLYGAGSLGGIVRLVPNAPLLGETTGSVALGYRATAHGAGGGDAAGMVNLPLVANLAAVRIVAYRAIDGGYIRDAARGVDDINRTDTAGGRLTARIAPGNGWTIDVGGVLQTIDSRDSQYAERGLPRLTRASAVAQPFDNDYLLGQVVVNKLWDSGVRLISASAAVRHKVAALDDATPADGPVTVFEQDNRILLLSNETRLTRTRADGTGWLAGASVVSDSERLTRAMGPPGATTRITGVRNAITDIALYGEATFGLMPHLQITAGGRLAYARLAGGGLDVKRHGRAEATRTEVEVLPSIALTWTPGGGATLFARYQEGFRPGGLSVGGAASTEPIKRFTGDSIGTAEIGARLGTRGRDRWSAAASLSYGHWEHIQADLVGRNGLPFSANIGTGRVLGAEASVAWRPLAGLVLDGALFLNDSKLTDPAGGFRNARKADLPNVGDVGARGAVAYRVEMGAGVAATFDASARYVGRSSLGVGALRGIDQGRYVDTAIDTRIGREALGLSLGITNLFDVEGNRFSLGNPFGVLDGRQITPLRPRTIRIGVDARF